MGARGVLAVPASARDEIKAFQEEAEQVEEGRRRDAGALGDADGQGEHGRRECHRESQLCAEGCERVFGAARGRGRGPTVRACGIINIPNPRTEMSALNIDMTKT